MSDSGQPNGPSSGPHNGHHQGASQAPRRTDGLVLVTGGSGHVGANLVRRLLKEGQAVRALLRQGSDNRALDGLDVERFHGDLRDPAAMKAAARGCRAIYHVAARISTVAGGEREIYDCNVIGTRNLLRGALAASVERVVVTGSLSAVGHQPDRPCDEEVPFYPFGHQLPYGHTKALVEHECWHAAAADGLDVVVATSCAVLGPNDFKPSRMGRVMCDFARRKVPAYIPGGFDFVNVDDLVEGHLLCMERGRRGHRYILSTSFHSMDEIMDMFSRVTGQRKPPLRIPGAVMAGISEVTSRVLTHFFPGVPQSLTPAAVRLLRMERRVDTGKAQRELGYRPTAVLPAIQAAYDDFVRRGEIAGAGASPGPGALSRDAVAAAAARGRATAAS